MPVAACLNYERDIIWRNTFWLRLPNQTAYEIATELLSMIYVINPLAFNLDVVPVPAKSLAQD